VNDSDVHSGMSSFFNLTLKKAVTSVYAFPLVCEKHGQLGLCKGCLSAGIMELQKEASHQKEGC
jgi:hypothetical protein